MVTLYAGLLAAALGGAVTVTAIVAAWLALGARRKTAQAETWLLEEGIDQALFNALRPVATDMWRDGWGLGIHSAATAANIHAEAKFNATDFFERWGRQWLNEIVRNRMNLLAQLLAEGPDDPVELAAQVRDLLASQDGAQLVAVTEVTRAVNIAAGETYRDAGIFEVQWVTEDDSRVCPACDENEAAGPRQIGTPFPGGAVAPPQHPRCRCALLPA